MKNLKWYHFLLVIPVILTIVNKIKEFQLDTIDTKVKKEDKQVSKKISKLTEQRQQIQINIAELEAKETEVDENWHLNRK